MEDVDVLVSKIKWLELPQQCTCTQKYLPQRLSDGERKAATSTVVPRVPYCSSAEPKNGLIMTCFFFLCPGDSCSPHFKRFFDLPVVRTLALEFAPNRNNNVLPAVAQGLDQSTCIPGRTNWRSVVWFWWIDRDTTEVVRSEQTDREFMIPAWQCPYNKCHAKSSFSQPRLLRKEACAGVDIFDKSLFSEKQMDLNKAFNLDSHFLYVMSREVHVSVQEEKTPYFGKPCRCRSWWLYTPHEAQFYTYSRSALVKLFGTSTSGH